jgi:hypothetical protein
MITGAAIIDDGGERQCPIGDYFGRLEVRTRRDHEEPSSRPGVAPWRDAHVNDLAVLVDRPVDVAPPARGLHVRLVHELAIADRVPIRTRRADKQRREALHSPIQGDIVNLDPTLSEELIDLPVRQADAQIPAHGEDDHLRRNRNPATLKPGPRVSNEREIDAYGHCRQASRSDQGTKTRSTHRTSFRHRQVGRSLAWRQRRSGLTTAFAALGPSAFSHHAGSQPGRERPEPHRKGPDDGGEDHEGRQTQNKEDPQRRFLGRAAHRVTV